MKNPVMMVHGVSCTGQVWTQFRAYFEAQGVHVYTPTLRPELRVSIQQRAVGAVRDLSLDDYVAQLEAEVQRIQLQTGMKPAVIGHSMGGLLAQALAEKNLVSAAVFISPSGPAGVRTVPTKMFWALYGAAYRAGWAPKIMRPDRRTTSNVVFNALPAAQHAATLGAMVYESGRAFAQLGNYPIDETKIRVPVLTIAATRDRLVPASWVRLTGKKYAAIGGEFREYPRHAHWLYAEPGWEEPAADIYAWLERVTASAELPLETRDEQPGKKSATQTLPGV
jgi:alpha-beta hydrolase superfamily lysophospholipase